MRGERERERGERDSDGEMGEERKTRIERWRGEVRRNRFG